MSKHRNSSPADRFSDWAIEAANWLGKRAGWLTSFFKSVFSRFTKASYSQSVNSGSHLQSVALEEHTGLAGMAMPSLPSTGRRTYYGSILLVLGIVASSFLVSILGISQLQNLRDQQVAFEQYRYTLANATAPVSDMDMNSKLLVEGTPVAQISIPKIGVNAIVVEGTTSDITMHGPGHRRDTVLPGQEGVSVIFGREFTYGAEFNRLSELKVGDKINAVTGQGESNYKVISKRYSGDDLPAAPEAGEGRLVLVSASGHIPLLPSDSIRVDAELVGDAYVTPMRNFTFAGLTTPEEAMQGDASVWPTLALVLSFLVLLVVVMALLRRFWGKWQTWIVAVPVLTAVGVFAATQVAILLPNIL